MFYLLEKFTYYLMKVNIVTLCYLIKVSKYKKNPPNRWVLISWSYDWSRRLQMVYDWSRRLRMVYDWLKSLRMVYDWSKSLWMVYDWSRRLMLVYYYSLIAHN